MFRQILRTTPLRNDIADDYFSNIRGRTFQEDCSFISTIRALVAPRMTENDRITFWTVQGSFTESQINRNSVRDLIEETGVYIDDFNDGDAVVYNLTGGSQNNALFIEKMKKGLTKTYTNWNVIEKVELFFRKTFSATCFINPEKKNFIVFVDAMDIRRYHYLQCGILAFMPWYFDPEKGVREEEMDLIKSLREKTSEKYEKCLAAIASKYNFRELRVKKLLNGFETKYERIKVDQVRRHIDELIAKINNYNNAIGDFLRDKRDYEIQMLGLQAKIASNDGNSAIEDYFLCNKNIFLESVSDTAMRFCTTGYVTYYDEDEAENAIENSDSYVYRPNGRGCNNIIPAEDMKMLMTAIFLDRSIKMKFCSCYTFDLTGNVRGESGHNYDRSEFGDCTPNTHIDRYSCLGNYQRVINELLREHDYIGAIEQCMASTVSLNFADHCVMEEFMRRIYGISDYTVNIRCIELPDGRVVEPKEAVEYLKSQNNTQEGEENG